MGVIVEACRECGIFQLHPIKNKLGNPDKPFLDYIFGQRHACAVAEYLAKLIAADRAGLHNGVVGQLFAKIFMDVKAYFTDKRVAVIAFSGIDGFAR